MECSYDITQMAETILSKSTFDEKFDNYIAHHGIKGQKWGVITKDPHAASGSRLERLFNPKARAAYKGYKEAYKKKQREAKIAAKKAKIGNDLKKINKHKELYTDEEIEKANRRSNMENALAKSLRAQKEERRQEKRNEKIEKQAYKDMLKREKTESARIESERKSKEKLQKMQLENAMALQKQRDNAQAEREKAAREYQTQKEIAQGKTLTARLQKAAKMTTSIFTVASTGKKMADLLGFTTEDTKDDQKKKQKT